VAEGKIQRKVQLEATQRGARVFRNQVGRYEVDGRWIQSGLCVGSSDLIGWTPVTIKPEDVGKQIAVFTALEIKTPRGKVSKDQQSFIAAVRTAGGMAGVVRSTEDLEGIIGSDGQAEKE